MCLILTFFNENNQSKIWIFEKLLLPLQCQKLISNNPLILIRYDTVNSQDEIK